MRSLVIFRFWLLELDSFTEGEAEVSLAGCPWHTADCQRGTGAQTSALPVKSISV